MRVVAFTKYDRAAASTRQRVLQYAPALAAAGIALDHRALLSNAYVRSLAAHVGFSRLEVARSYARRLRDLLDPRLEADAIWVQMELFPYFPAAIERLAFRRGVPVIYDWDDAVCVPYARHRRAAIRALLGRKFEPVLRRAAAVTCGNAFLRDYAQPFCKEAMVVPTVVDTDLYVPINKHDGPLTLGWIGSPSTWANVRPMLPLIERFCREHGARFRAVGAGKAALGDRFDCLELVGWREDSEVLEVQHFDIGIMPLIDAAFEQGKSGYKLIQYMACGLPTVASPVGVNREIVADGESGLLAVTPDEWAGALARLAADSQLRQRMGALGRQRVVAAYSLQSQAPRLVNLFLDLGRRRTS